MKSPTKFIPDFASLLFPLKVSYDYIAHGFIALRHAITIEGHLRVIRGGLIVGVRVLRAKRTRLGWSRVVNRHGGQGFVV